MRRALFSLFLAVGFLLLSPPAQAGSKSSGTAPEKIVGSDLESRKVKEALKGKKIACSDFSSRKTKICRVLSYEYLAKTISPDGTPLGAVEEAALVMQTFGNKDLILSAGVNWSVRQGDEEPIRARFRYLSEKLEKTYGSPTATAPPALAPNIMEGLEEYRQFTDGNVSATLILRKKGEGKKRKISVSITFTDQKALQEFNKP